VTASGSDDLSIERSFCGHEQSAHTARRKLVVYAVHIPEDRLKVISQIRAIHAISSAEHQSSRMGSRMWRAILGIRRSGNLGHGAV